MLYPDFTAELEAYSTQYGMPERLELLLCDTNAILRGKWLPTASIGKLASGAVRLPLSTYFLNIDGEDVPESGLGIVNGDPDGIMTPIVGTLKKVGWATSNVAQVQCFLSEQGGGASPLDSRVLLKKMVERFAARGLTPVVATELEFYVVRQRQEADEKPTPPPHTPVAQTLDLDVASHSEAFLSDVIKNCAAQGIPADTIIAENGPGQFEINFHHCADAVLAADYALLFRRIVRGVALKHGLEATFMAKPYADCSGNGMHVHASLLDNDGRNAMAFEGDELSPILRACIGGLLVSMHEMQAVFAPNMNSYRRLQPMSFAPDTPNWGYDNRGAAIRLPETKGAGARLEHRVAGSDVNPYLALSAILGGMLYGLETKPDIGLPLDDPCSKPTISLYRNWSQALDAFAGSELAANFFGEKFRNAYVAIKQNEIAALTTIITTGEYRTYLGRL